MNQKKKIGQSIRFGIVTIICPSMTSIVCKFSCCLVDASCSWSTVLDLRYNAWTAKHCNVFYHSLKSTSKPYAVSFSAHIFWININDCLVIVTDVAIPWVLITVAVVQATGSGDKRPHFTVEPPSRILWPATRGAYAVCRATGHPPPEIHWVTAEGQILTTIPGLR